MRFEEPILTVMTVDFLIFRPGVIVGRVFFELIIALVLVMSHPCSNMPLLLVTSKLRELFGAMSLRRMVVAFSVGILFFNGKLIMLEWGALPILVRSFAGDIAGMRILTLSFWLLFGRKGVGVVISGIFRSFLCIALMVEMSLRIR